MVKTLAAIYDRKPCKGRRMEAKQNKSNRKCHDCLLFLLSLGNTKGEVKTADRENSVLDSHSLHSFFVFFVACINKMSLAVLVQ